MTAVSTLRKSLTNGQRALQLFLTAEPGVKQLGALREARTGGGRSLSSKPEAFC